jgi:hypothetical protein
VAGQSPNRAGQSAINLTDLGGFSTSVANAFLGADGSGDPKIVSLPTGEGFEVAFSSRVTGTGWGGAASYSVGYDIPWRRGSAEEYVNASYATISTGNWVDSLTLVAGTYMIVASFPSSASSASDTLDVRLYDNNATTYHGPTYQMGGGRGCDLIFTVPTFSSSASVRWRVTALTGSWALPYAATHRGCRILILKV